MARRATGIGRADMIPDVQCVLRGLLWNFDFDWHELKPVEHLEWLQRNVRQYLADPDVVFLLRGKASRRGDREYNRRLSERRANEVKRWLHDNSGGRQIRVLVKDVGERESTRGREDEDSHRGVEILVRRGDEPLEFDDEIVVGIPNPNLGFPRLRQAVWDHAPRIPRIPHRTPSHDAYTEMSLLIALVRALQGSPGFIGPGGRMIWGSLQAIVHGDRRNEATAAVIGYADTLARMAAAMPAHPQGIRPSLPQPIVPDSYRSNCMGMPLMIHGYTRGYWRVRTLLNQLDNVPPPGTWPSEFLLFELRERYSRPGRFVRVDEIRAGILADCLRIDLDHIIGESVSPRPAP